MIHLTSKLYFQSLLLPKSLTIYLMFAPTVRRSYIFDFCKCSWSGVDTGCHDPPPPSLYDSTVGWRLRMFRLQLKCDGTCDAWEGEWRGNWRREWVASTITLPRNMVYPALLPLMRTPRLPVVDRTDAHADLNGLVRFAERRNLVSARVPSHFNRPLTK